MCLDEGIPNSREFEIPWNSNASIVLSFFKKQMLQLFGSSNRILFIYKIYCLGQAIGLLSFAKFVV